MARKEFKAGDKVVAAKAKNKVKFGDEALVTGVKKESFFFKGEVEVVTENGSTEKMLMDDVVKKD